MKKFNPDYISFEMTCEQDPSSPKKSLEFPEDIKDAKKAIRDGNVWGWGIVKIEGRYPHPADQMWSLHAVDYLGGCTYKDRADFERDPYYKQMRENVIAVLRAKWEAARQFYLAQENPRSRPRKAGKVGH